MNKKLLISLCGLSLVGCGIDNSNIKPEKTAVSVESSAEEKVESIDPKYVKKGQLLEVGQWTNADGIGQLTLEKITSPQEDITLNDGNVINIESAKIFKINNMKDTFRKMFNLDTTEKEAYYLQIIFSYTNNLSETVHETGPNYGLLNTGTQVNLTDFGEYNSVMSTATVNKGVSGIVPNADISSIKLEFHSNDYENISDSTMVTVNFE